MGEKFLQEGEKKDGLVSLSQMSEHGSSGYCLFIKKTQDYNQVKRVGQRVQDPLFNLMFCESRHPQSRVGIVVGRRFGKAVLRNRAKRIFRELVRAIQDDLVKGYDIVIFPKSPVLQKKIQIVQKNWKVALHRIGVLRPTPHHSYPDSFSG
ncbi:MAG: hypothetical protein NPIRA04_14680 [Nitrospirales bacterium]|nr:MAG: hypothetical protein NPIRA04_14680 [Nitrospirales bacterium]